MPDQEAAPAADTSIATQVAPESAPAPQQEEQIFSDDSIGSAIAEALAQDQSRRPRVSDEAPEEQFTPETKPATPEAEAPAAQPGEDLGVDEATARKMTPQAKKAFASMRTELSTAQKALQEKEAKLAELETKLKTASPEQFDKIKQELEARVNDLSQKTSSYEEKLRLYDVTNSPEFQKTVSEPLDRMNTLLTGYATKYAVPQADLIKALVETDELKQSDLLADVATGFNERDRMKLFTLVEDYTKVIGTREKFLADTKATLDVINERRAKQQEELKSRFQTDMKKSLTDSWGQLTEKLPFLKDESNDAVKKALTDIRNKSEQVDVVRLAPRDRATMIHRAMILPVVVATMERQAKELAEANKKLASIQKATPSPSGGAGAGNASSGVADDLSFADAIAKAMGG